MGADAGELRSLAHDFGLVAPKVAAKVKPIMAKTGVQMKKRLQADLRRSPHFKQIAASVDYEVKTFGFGGDGVIQMEVGVNPDRGSAPGLNHIAYFGDSRGGGGTVNDPIVAMRLEEPVFLGFLQMATEGLL